jgi:hypothetical protein
VSIVPEMVGKWERRKDTAQVVVESGASHAGRIMGIVAGAVRDVTSEVGAFATDVFEMGEASRRAAAEHDEPDRGGADTR